MGLPQRKRLEDELLDPTAVRREYRRQRARRRAREDKARERQLAGLRFWLAVTVVIGASILMLDVVWREIQHLFGL